jgi:hypothetical protein
VADHPDAHVMIYPKRGADLAREMKWLGTYRYGVFNLGADSPDELFARFHRICEQITFHPRVKPGTDHSYKLFGDRLGKMGSDPTFQPGETG